MAHIGQEPRLASVALFGGRACRLQPLLAITLGASIAHRGHQLTLRRPAQGDLQTALGVVAGSGDQFDLQVTGPGPPRHMQRPGQAGQVGIGDQMAEVAADQPLWRASQRRPHRRQHRPGPIQLQQQRRLERQQPQRQIGAIIATALSARVAA